MFVKYQLLQFLLYSSRRLTAHFCQVFTTSRAAAKQLAFPAPTSKQLAQQLLTYIIWAREQLARTAGTAAIWCNLPGLHNMFTAAAEVSI